MTTTTTSTPHPSFAQTAGYYLGVFLGVATGFMVAQAWNTAIRDSVDRTWGNPPPHFPPCPAEGGCSCAFHQAGGRGGGSSGSGSGSAAFQWTYAVLITLLAVCLMVSWSYAFSIFGGGCGTGGGAPPVFLSPSPLVPPPRPLQQPQLPPPTRGLEEIRARVQSRLLLLPGAAGQGS